jgi:hypothetical protein
MRYCQGQQHTYPSAATSLCLCSQKNKSWCRIALHQLHYFSVQNIPSETFLLSLAVGNRTSAHPLLLRLV